MNKWLKSFKILKNFDFLEFFMIFLIFYIKSGKKSPGAFSLTRSGDRSYILYIRKWNMIYKERNYFKAILRLKWLNFAKVTEISHSNVPYRFLRYFDVSEHISNIIFILYPLLRSRIALWSHKKLQNCLFWPLGPL